MNQDFLNELLRAPGASSFETQSAKPWRDKALEHGADLEVDAYNNSYAQFNKGKTPHIMLAGHIDEIGLIITYIDDDGFIYFKGIGGWDSQQLVGQRVKIIGYKGELRGIIGKKPIHLMNASDRTKVSKIEDLWIDIGAKDKEQAKEHVRIGDFAVIDQDVVELLNGQIASKAIDNRIGAYIVLEAARRAVKDKKAKAAVTAVATVQEEIAGVGAISAAYFLNPDLAIAVDVTHATDIPGINKKQDGDIPLGSGPTLSVGGIVHKGLFEALVATAEKLKMPYSIEPAPRRTFTDGDHIVKSRAGVPTAVISVPNRYMHSPNEMIDLNDVEQIIVLMTAFIKSLNSKLSFLKN